MFIVVIRPPPMNTRSQLLEMYSPFMRNIVSSFSLFRISVLLQTCCNVLCT